MGILNRNNLREPIVEPLVDATDSDSSNRAMLERAGLEFDFFVDTAEGPAMAFDTETVIARAESARKRLLSGELGQIALQ